MGVKLYNRFPIRIKTLKDFKSFKKEVIFLLINNSVHTINEFLQFNNRSYYGDMSLYLVYLHQLNIVFCYLLLVPYY